MTTLKLSLSEKDLPANDRFLLQQQAQGNTVLGPGDWSGAVLRALVNRLRAISPEGLEIAEVEVAVSLEGSIFGNGVTGEAIVRFQAKK